MSSIEFLTSFQTTRSQSLTEGNEKQGRFGSAVFARAGRLTTYRIAKWMTVNSVVCLRETSQYFIVVNNFISANLFLLKNNIQKY